MSRHFCFGRVLLCEIALLSLASCAFGEGAMQRIEVSADKKGFVESGAKRPFVVWGVNYDHDRNGRLLEDYWEKEWATVEEDFAEIKRLGANTVRVHLQVGKFLTSLDKPNAAALKQLARLLKLAEKERLYLDLTGLGCYHKADVPAWYDNLTEAERWRAQAGFWREVAATCKESPVVFCYDLMNEPVVPGGKREDRDWLGPPFGGKHFVQVITLDQAERPRPEIAKAWIATLTAAIREVDPKRLITVGLVDWSLDRPGLTSGFVPEKIAGDLDFLAVHLYPASGKQEEALKTLAGFQVGKPVIIEETFPLGCTVEELDDFVFHSRNRCQGWISFYWGQTPDELRLGKSLAETVTGKWLEVFEKRGASMLKLAP